MKFGDFLVRRREQMYRVAGLKPGTYIREDRGALPCATCRAERLDVEEGLVQVGDDVLYVLDAHGEADEAFGDAYALADFDGHGGVGHQRGKGNESFDAAKAFG